MRLLMDLMSGEGVRNILALMNCAFSVCILGALYFHHRTGVSGPCSASIRILTAMADLRARLDILDHIVMEQGSRLDNGRL